ncbi:tyrosine-protein phosphatase non-receptor type 18 isoform X2 [Hemicordylus capensis]|uniref:tyrosine-protein phosphatase non-receptor type 18 isoform X2 n=1 Tax=Hemicordylus capensis TaxID=884348 RepID=UPI0023035A50|nr:tyrosine-protein phosphatase non-receptor type 18 isoform X2 [Hemicordylus capensis]
MSRCTENLKGFLAQVEAKAGQEKGQLVEEFQEIKARAAAFRQQQGISTAAGGNKENIKKNRYKDILPYDQTRVVLNALTEEGQADYINANFIQGVDNKRCYIATQGPLAHTVLDFWHMVWQYRVKVIVMACREVEMGKKKCERYWPLAEETLQFGPFSIAQAKEQELNPDVILRKLTLTFQKEERVVSHFQYIAWPDRGIPDTYGYFLAMIEQVRHKQGEDTVPVCIHCSAGCGRTGVICTLDYIRQLLLKQRIPPHFSIFDVVLEMRKQRPAAVQTQYEFVYHAVIEMFRACLGFCNPNYENLKENRLPLYDDALSLRHPAVPQLKRSTILRSISVPADPTPAALPELPPKLLRDMGDTYAVVNKARRGGAGASSANGTKPDGEAPLYAAVKPRASNVPDISAIDPNAFAGLQASHSLPGSPVRRPPPGLACEYTQIAPSVPADVSSRGTTSPSHTNGLGKTLLRNLMSPVFTSSPGKKAPPSSRTVPTQAYEDVGDAIPRGGPNAAGASTNAMGFNVRIGKPKGPRDPPAEWSRV